RNCRRVAQSSSAGRSLPGRIGRPNGHQPVYDRPAGKRADAAEHEDALALCRGDREQIPRAAIGGLMRRLHSRALDFVLEMTPYPVDELAIAGVVAQFEYVARPLERDVDDG